VLSAWRDGVVSAAVEGAAAQDALLFKGFAVSVGAILTPWVSVPSSAWTVRPVEVLVALMVSGEPQFPLPSHYRSR
jgi:hypothetical protein